MIHRWLTDEPWRWLLWLGGVLCIVVGLGAVGYLGGIFEVAEDPKDSPVHVEELQVAEPLTEGTQAVIRDRLQTVAAVTAPYDEYEQAGPEDVDETPSTEADFDDQCVTVVKEIAFCSNEDEFLEIIGTAPNLRTGDERQGFMDRVDVWFEPGGARADCERVVAATDYDDEMASRWQRATDASGALCEEFGQVLLAVDLLESLGLFWSE